MKAAFNDIIIVNNEASTSAKSTPTGLASPLFNQTLPVKRKLEEAPSMSLDELLMNEDINTKPVEKVAIKSPELQMLPNKR